MKAKFYLSKVDRPIWSKSTGHVCIKYIFRPRNAGISPMCLLPWNRSTSVPLSQSGHLFLPSKSRRSITSFPSLPHTSFYTVGLTWFEISSTPLIYPQSKPEMTRPLVNTRTRGYAETSGVWAIRTTVPPQKWKRNATWLGETEFGFRVPNLEMMGTCSVSG